MEHRAKKLPRVERAVARLDGATLRRGTRDEEGDRPIPRRMERRIMGRPARRASNDAGAGVLSRHH